MRFLVGEVPPCGDAQPTKRVRQWDARKVDIRLPGKGSSNSHGARPVPLIIMMINSDQEVVNKELSPSGTREVHQSASTSRGRWSIQGSLA